MNRESIYKVDTVMEAGDHRKFLYIVTFVQSRAIIRFLMVISSIGALLLPVITVGFSLKSFVISWLFTLAVMLAATGIKIEWRNRQRVKQDKSGVFGSITSIEFFNDYLTMESSIAKGKSHLEYKDFHKVLESKGYFIFYYTAGQATMLRKRDMGNIDRVSFRTFIMESFDKSYRKI